MESVHWLVIIIAGTKNVCNATELSGLDGTRLSSKMVKTAEAG